MHWSQWNVDHVCSFLLAAGCDADVVQKASDEELNGYSLTWIIEEECLWELGIIDTFLKARVVGNLEKFKAEQDRAHELWEKQMAWYWAAMGSSWNGTPPHPHEWEQTPCVPSACATIMPRTSEQAWNALRDVLKEHNINVEEIVSLSEQQRKLKNNDQSVEQRALSLKATGHVDAPHRRHMQGINRCIVDLNQSMWDWVFQLDLHHKSSFDAVFDCAFDNAVLLCCHELGYLFITFLCIKCDCHQRQRMVSTLSCDVTSEMLAMDRWGTQVLQKLLMDDSFPVASKTALMANIFVAFQSRGARCLSLLDDLHANWLIHGCFKAEVYGKVPRGFVGPILDGLVSKLDTLLASTKTNFCYAYKEIMWAIEYCSLTESGRLTGHVIMKWCARRATELINHRFGNILMQHVVVFGTAEIQVEVAKAAIQSFSEYLHMAKTEGSRTRWFASNVLRCCITHMEGSPWVFFRKEVLELMRSKPSGRQWRLHFGRFQSVCEDKNNTFLGRCIMELADEEQRRQMKNCFSNIDLHPFPFKVMCGFKASLFWQSWKSISTIGDPQKMTLKEGSSHASSHWIEAGINTQNPLCIAIYKFHLPFQHVGQSLNDLALRTKYQMVPFAIETVEEGVCTHVCPHNANVIRLALGCALWVMFETCPSAQSLTQFLGTEVKFKTELECRWLIVRTFPISALPSGYGGTIGELGRHLWSNFAISVLGCYETERDVALHPDPERKIGLDTTLLVFDPDFKKLQDLVSEGLDL